MKQAKISRSDTKIATPFFQKKSKDHFFSNNNNSFFNSTIQAKLTVNQPNDPYEKEADAMADKITGNTKDRSPDKSTPFFIKSNSFVQRKCAHCEEEEKLQKKPIFESNQEQKEDKKNIQRACASCGQEKLQRKPQAVSAPQTINNIESNLNASKGSGAPLPENTRSQMESSFGYDFGNVRIHTGSNAETMSRDLNAHAFTHGNDIYFNAGKYNVNSNHGKHLLAHELTHTIQQGTNNSHGVQRDFWDDATSYYNAAANVVTSTGEAVYQQAAAVVTTVEQKVNQVVDSTVQQAAGAVKWAEQKSAAAVDWAKQQAAGAGSVIGLDNKKSNVLAQIGKVRQRLSGNAGIYLSDDQLASLNGHLETVRNESQGLISLGNISGSQDADTPLGSKAIGAAEILDLIQNMQALVQAPFMSSDSVSNTNDASTVQNSIQRYAIAIPVIGILVILEIIAIFLIILLLLYAAVLIYEKIKKDQKEKEEEEEREREKREREKEEERKRKEKEDKQKEENDKKLGLPCIPPEALKVTNNAAGNFIIRNIYSDNWVDFCRNKYENRNGKGKYCGDKKEISNNRRDFFVKIDKTFQVCQVMVCSPLGKIIAYSPGVKDASLEGGDEHAELKALPFIEIQLAKNPKDCVGAKLTSVCFDFACSKSETSCDSRLREFTNTHLPGGSFESFNSRDRGDMESVADAAFDDAVKKICP